MFGFLNPGITSARYRACYARCCQFQHVLHGALSLPFHAFESVFLYVAAVDSGLVEHGALPQQSCCRLQTSQLLLKAQDSPVGRFTASFSMVLTWLKLEDDIHDDHSVKARLQRKLFDRPIRRAQEYFRKLDPNSLERIQQILSDQGALEVAKDVPLERYVAPTSDGFEYVFGLFERQCLRRPSTGALALAGRDIGAAMIAIDASRDWRADQQAGRTNPVTCEGDACTARDFARRRLQSAANYCSKEFGMGALTAEVLETVDRRVEAADRTCAICATTKTRNWAAILPFSRQSVVLDMVCCCPCGDGAVAFDSTECGGIICGCFCCSVACCYCGCLSRF